MSDGGPLICMETNHENSWGGIDRLSVPGEGAHNDYDRACRANAYTWPIRLAEGVGLILSMGKLDTSIWTLPSGSLCLVSVNCADPDVDESEKLARVDETIFDRPLAASNISFSSPHLVLFDSAWPGDDARKKSLSFQIRPGCYRVLSAAFDPDEEISFVLHRFDRLA